MKRLTVMKPRILDYCAIAISIAVIAAFSVYAYGGRARAGEVVIEASGAAWIYPLNVDRTEAVNGPIGDTIVTIQGGRASVTDSPCPDKLCVHMPPISQPGQWIACLPNKVFVRVKGEDAQEIDDLSY
jgi:hypothetical protein